MTSHSDFLRALTDHLDRHGLPIVNIHSEHAGGWTLQLIADGAAHDLVAWASSLGAAGLYVHPILDKPQVSAGFRATIEGWSVGRGGLRGCTTGSSWV